MSSTPEDEVVASIHYDLIELIENAAHSVVHMHSDNKQAQVDVMWYLFCECISAFTQTMPGVSKKQVLELADKSFDIARRLNPVPEQDVKTDRLN